MFQASSLYAYYLAVVLCICFHLLQEETSLMMVEQETDLCVYQNVIRSDLKKSLCVYAVCVCVCVLCMCVCV